MSNTITNRQIIFILYLTLTTYFFTTISKDMAESAGRGFWMTLLMTAIIFSVGAVLITLLNTKYEGKMLFDYSSLIIGKFGAYVVSIFYIIYFGLIIVYIVTQISTVLKNNFLYQSPPWVTMLIGIPVYCYIAYKGITNVARLFEFVGLITVISGVFVLLLMITQSDVNNILPLFSSHDIGKYFKAIKPAIISFLGIEVLLVIPFTKENGKKAITTAFFTIIGIGLLFIMNVVACIMRLGLHEIVHYNDALIVAIRNMEVPFLDFFQRLDFLYLTVGFMGFFLGATIFYTAFIELLCKVFPKAKRVTIVIIVGVTSYLLSLLAIQGLEYSQFFEEVSVYMCLVTTFVIPALLLIISKVKRHAL